MANIFGLIGSGGIDDYWSENVRRSVLYRYPQAKAPLTFLNSLQDSEETDKPEFGWWEERDTTVKTSTATSGGLGGGGNGPFTNAALTTSQAAAGFNVVVGTVYGLFLVDASQFQVYDLIHIRNVPNGAASANLQVRGVVTAVNASTNTVTFRAIEAVTSVSNDTDANAIEVFFYGSAAPEGTKSRTGSYSFPIIAKNYTQIHKNALNITRTALKAGVRYDQKGIYQDKAKKLALRHMKGLELSLLKGRRALATTTNEDGDNVQEYKTGGLEWFLEQWELGNTGNGGAFDYRPGAANITNSAWQTTDDKRIIDVNGTLTVEQFENLIERMFRYTADESFEKLVLCGSGFIKAFNQLCELKSYKVTQLYHKEDTFGMSVTRWESLWGNLVFKTHPLLTEDAAWRGDAYVIDLPCLKHRPLTDSDTVFLEGRQDNDYDGRKDVWITEAGSEIAFPENHMYIKGVTGTVQG